MATAESMENNATATCQQLLTIIVPVKNRPELILRTLDSIVSQTCRDFRLIIVDNGSTDATPEAIRNWIVRNSYRLPSVEFVEEQKTGAPAARNCGLQMVVTPYVAFFDSDDLMRPRHIARILDAIKTNPDAELFRWPITIIDEDGWSRLKDPHSDSASEMQLHLLHSTLATHRWAARTDLVRRCGGWDESLDSCQDYELGVRLLKAASGNPVVIYGEPTVAIYPSPDSISRPSRADRFQAISSAFNKIDAVIADDPQARMTMRYHRAITAAMLSREGAGHLSVRLMDEATKDASGRMSLKLHLVWLIHRMLGRGGGMIALFFMR